jgi:CDP-diacylglycerol--glycerol-3-phosphate 3-phosphatidyltransferase
MPWNTPNLLTMLRIALIPVFVFVYHLPFSWARFAAATLFVSAALTDWLDGYLARRWHQSSAFGAFLDPVADKLMVASALVLLVSDPRVLAQVWNARLFAVVVLIILGRELAVSALREWMAELGKRASVAVSLIGKFKTSGQMVAIACLLYQQPLLGLSLFVLGELLLYAAAALTLWSMVVYLHAAWPDLMRPRED